MVGCSCIVRCLFLFIGLSSLVMDSLAYVRDPPFIPPYLVHPKPLKCPTIPGYIKLPPILHPYDPYVDLTADTVPPYYTHAEQSPGAYPFPGGASTHRTHRVRKPTYKNKPWNPWILGKRDEAEHINKEDEESGRVLLEKLGDLVLQIVESHPEYEVTVRELLIHKRVFEILKEIRNRNDRKSLLEQFGKMRPEFADLSIELEDLMTNDRYKYIWGKDKEHVSVPPKKYKPTKKTHYAARSKLIPYRPFVHGHLKKVLKTMPKYITTQKPYPHNIYTPSQDEKYFAILNELASKDSSNYKPIVGRGQQTIDEYIKENFHYLLLLREVYYPNEEVLARLEENGVSPKDFQSLEDYINEMEREFILFLLDTYDENQKYDHEDYPPTRGNSELAVLDFLCRNLAYADLLLHPEKEEALFPKGRRHNFDMDGDVEDETIPTPSCTDIFRIDLDKLVHTDLWEENNTMRELISILAKCKTVYGAILHPIEHYKLGHSKSPYSGFSHFRRSHLESESQMETSLEPEASKTDTPELFHEIYHTTKHVLLTIIVETMMKATKQDIFDEQGVDTLGESKLKSNKKLDNVQSIMEGRHSFEVLLGLMRARLYVFENMQELFDAVFVHFVKTLHDTDGNDKLESKNIPLSTYKQFYLMLTGKRHTKEDIMAMLEKNIRNYLQQFNL